MREKVEKGHDASLQLQKMRERGKTRKLGEKVLEKGCSTNAVIMRDEKERRNEKIERDHKVKRGHNAIVVVTIDERKERQKS